jgi:hypothetical protein
LYIYTDVRCSICPLSHMLYTHTGVRRFAVWSVIPASDTPLIRRTENRSLALSLESAVDLSLEAALTSFQKEHNSSRLAIFPWRQWYEAVTGNSSSTDFTNISDK